ncbi:MAG: OmpH family outer membrane protein [Proteobacteria bacterium]|nr:OmpH family outer membrane protein [Pseudomonadota bacterium]
MSRLTYSFALALWVAAASTLLASAPSSAQTDKSLAVQNIGIIDVQRILQQSLAYKSIRPQMTTLKKDFEQKFRTAEEELRSTNKDLQRERTILSPDAFAQRQRDFRKRVDTVQRDMQAVNRLLDRALSISVGKIQLAAKDITATLAKEMKIDLILSNSGITFAAPRLDLTDLVLDRLNKRLPSVKVVLPPPPKTSDDRKK